MKRALKNWPIPTFESAAVEGIEDAADRPARPTHTHEEYGRPDDVPQERNRTTG
jgi:hypothetical protein